MPCTLTRACHRLSPPGCPKVRLAHIGCYPGSDHDRNVPCCTSTDIKLKYPDHGQRGRAHGAIYCCISAQTWLGPSQQNAYKRTTALRELGWMFLGTTKNEKLLHIFWARFCCPFQNMPPKVHIHLVRNTLVPVIDRSNLLL